MSDERQAFEQLHAIPSGAIWCENRDVYIHKNYSGLVLHPINESWKAFCEGALWQASRQALEGEATAHVFPDDIKKLGSSECTVNAYSVEMGDPDRGITVPLYTHPASRQALEGEQLEVWLGNGDKSVADIYAEDGSYAGIGIFQPENGRTGAIGQSDGEIDGRPLDEVNAIVLIKSTRPESLQVMIDELTEAMARLGSTPTKTDEWIKCSERFPDLGQRVILKSRGVVQHYMPVFEQGDNDYGMGDYFWDFEDINDIDNPLVNFENDSWMPRPEQLNQEQDQ